MVEAGKAPATRKLPSDLSLYLLLSLSSTPHTHTAPIQEYIQPLKYLWAGMFLLMSSSEAVLQGSLPTHPLPSPCGWSFAKVWTSVYCSSSAEKASSAPAAHRMTPVDHGFRELNSQRCSCSLCTESPSAAANLSLLFIYAMCKVKSNAVVTF